MNKTKILDNLQRLRGLVEAFPEELINLDRFCITKDCGTLFCVAGLMATDPYFQRFGYKLNRSSEYTNSPFYVYRESNYIFDRINGIDVSADIFGVDAYDRLFDQRGNGEFDSDLLGFDEDGHPDSHNEDVTDKQLALYRIDRQIEEYTTETVTE